MRKSRGIFPAAPMCETLEPRVLLSWSFDPTPGTIAEAGSRTLTQSISVDFNGDGTPDIAAAAGRDLLILIGRANGTFAPAVVALHLNANVGLLAAHDFNGDGRIDLISAQNSSAPSGRAWVRTILNTTVGFHLDHVTRVAGRALGVVVGRLDTDAFPDALILAEHASSIFSSPQRSLVWLERNSSSLAIGGPPFPSPGHLGVPALIDLDHNGADEVLVPSAIRSSSSTPFEIVFDGKIALLSVASGAWVEAASISLTGLIDSVSIVDTNGDTIPEAVFALRGLQVPSLNSAASRAYLATLTPGSIAAPTLIMNRSPDHWFDAYQSLDHRIIGAADVNGDGRTDLLVSTYMGSSQASAGTSSTWRYDLLSTLVQRPDGGFDEITIRSTSTSVFATHNEARYIAQRAGLVPYALIPAYNGRGPAVVGITRPRLLPSFSPEVNSLELLTTTSQWKAPSVAWMSFRRLSLPHTEFPTAHVGEHWRLRIYATQPEASRSAPVASATLYRDSDGDGVWTNNDEVIAFGFALGPVDIPPFTYPTNAGTAAWGLDFTVPPTWLVASVTTPQTFFVRVTDATGQSNNPNFVRPILYVNP